MLMSVLARTNRPATEDYIRPPVTRALGHFLRRRACGMLGSECPRSLGIGLNFEAAPEIDSFERICLSDCRGYTSCASLKVRIMSITRDSAGVHDRVPIVEGVSSTAT